MRLLLYFLALLTGFSAAEAARPIEATSPTSTASPIALAEAYAAVVTTSANIQREFSDDVTSPSAERPGLSLLEEVVSASTPISRADRAHK